MIGSEIPVILETGRRRAGLSLADLWWGYIGLGGMASPSQLTDILTGSAPPCRVDYDLLAQVLNDRFTEIDLERPVPYADELGR